MASSSRQPKDNKNREKPERSQLHQQRMKAIEYAFSSLLAGSLFLILYITLPLQLAISYLLFGVGMALLFTAFVLVIFTWRNSLVSKAGRLVIVIRPILFTASVLSVAATLTQMLIIFGVNSFQGILSILVALIFLILVIVSLLISDIRKLISR